MKAISLWQPWSTAIALRLKRNETRGWATRYRRPLAIHAARRWAAEQLSFAEAMRASGVASALPRKLPFGAVVAVAWLVDCRPAMEILPTIGAVERAFGDYGPGRFAWLLEDIQPLREPLPFIGRQGFFDVPAGLLEPLAPDWFAKQAA